MSQEYQPTTPPEVEDQVLLRYLMGELHQLSQLFAESTSQLEVLHMEPQRPRIGLVVYADGVNFNPGLNGEGLYVFTSAGWVKVGSEPDDTAGGFETGAFSPTVIFTALGNLTVNYHTRVGEFVRAGDIVAIKLTLDFTPIYTTSSGMFNIEGLPFVASAADWLFQVRPYTANALSYPAGRVWALAELGNVTALRLMGMADGTVPSQFSVTQFPSGSRKGIKISGVYRRAA